MIIIVRTWRLSVFCAVMTALVLPGCTSKPMESVSDVAETSAESATPQAATADARQPMEEAVREPSDGSSAPAQVSETPAAPVETPAPQPNPTEQLARMRTVAEKFGPCSIGPMRISRRRCRRSCFRRAMRHCAA